MIDKCQISLKILLKNEQGQVIVLRTLSGTKWGRDGFYDLPGGRIDSEEFLVGFKASLEREVSEELGDVKVQIHEKPVALGRHVITGDHPDIHVVYIFFKADYIEGDIQANVEHAGHEWVDLESIELEKYFTSGILEGVKMYLGR